MSRFLSALRPAPAGFVACELGRRQLLGGPMVVLAHSVDEVVGAVPSGRDRLEGVVLTLGDPPHVDRVGRLLWHLTMPESSLPDLWVPLELALSTIGAAADLAEASVASKHLLDRSEHDLQVTREDYTRVTRRLLDDLQRIKALSQQQQREAEIREELYRRANEAVAIRDEFLSIASHELRTPITVLLLTVRGLRRAHERADTAALQHGWTVLEREAKRLTTLVDELLMVGDLDELDLRLEQVDLVAVVRRVLEGMRVPLAQASCEVTLATPDSAIGRWDERRLEQVVGSLLSNAAKFGAGKPIEIALRSSGHDVFLTICDHGIGIAKEALPHIFEKFARGVSSRSYGGFGLGLHITRRIVNALGGSIRAESEAGRRTTISVELPISGPPVEPAVQPG